MSYATLDTNALIWAIKDECTPGQEQMKRRAQWALREIERDKLKIVLTAVALAELVVPMTDEKTGAFIAAAEERFIIAPFDARAASVAAKLWRLNHKLSKAERVQRSVLKADVLIIASAYCAGVGRFYTHDRRCRKLAQSLMEARDLPENPDDLFENAGV